MYTVQLYCERFAVSQHKQTTQIHTMHLQYLKIGTPPAHDAPQCSTSDAPKAQHHPNHSPCLRYGGHCTPLCTVLCRAHRTLYTLYYTAQYKSTIHRTRYIMRSTYGTSYFHGRENYEDKSSGKDQQQFRNRIFSS